MGDYTPNEQELIEGSTVSEDERRRAIARIKAEAWDEGWFTAADEARGDVWFPAWGRQTNPYREEAGL